MKYLILIFLLPLSLSAQQNDFGQGFPNPEDYVSEPPSDGGKLTYDISLSSGSVNNASYTEINVGLNYFYLDWLNWRNSVFTRMMSEGEDAYGLDSSIRGYSVTPMGEEGGLTLFGGPGVRVPSEGDVVAFAEAGIILNTSGLTVGLGIKSLFNKMNDKDAENDTQYFIILAGSGSL